MTVFCIQDSSCSFTIIAGAKDFGLGSSERQDDMSIVHMLQDVHRAEDVQAPWAAIR